MASETYLKENNIAPLAGEIAAIATTSTSASTDLSAAGQLGALTTCGDGFRMICDQNLFFHFGAASGTVDDTATSGATRGALLPANTVFPFRFGSYESNPVFLTHKAAAGGTIRIWRATDNQ